MRSAEHVDRIVVIGGGISGLSSAFYLRKLAREQGREVQITIVEEAPKAGGKINTLHKDGFVIEKGPDSFLARKQAIIELANELGLQGELARTNPQAKKTYILHGGKLHPMPQGLVLGVPTAIAPFAMTGLLSPAGKARALLDLAKPPLATEADESIGAFLKRRVGPEIVERIAEPLLAGIYAGELDKLSLRATFPQFRESERKYGSLIRGMRRGRQQQAAIKGVPEQLQGSVFLTFRNGLSTLVDALLASLSDVRIITGAKVNKLERDGNAGANANANAGANGNGSGTGSGMVESGNGKGAYAIQLSTGEELTADGIIVTVQAFAAAELLGPHVPVPELQDMRYVSVANIAMAFDKAAFGLEFDGSGFVVPRTEGRHITACTWTSSKWVHTSPPDKVLLRCYVGRAGDEEKVSLPDSRLQEHVLEDIRSILGVEARPLFTEITRLYHSMPQYAVGHVERMAAMRERLDRQLPGVWVTGAAFDGVGLPDCIRQGKEAAGKLLASLISSFAEK